MNYEDGMGIMASIYITGHPDDMEQESEIIERLEREEEFNAIRYENEAEVPLNELKTILSEMNLILVFVSSKYLYTQNVARNFIIPFAEKKQIPVIAFSLEKYIEYDFRKQFGDAIFLDPYQEKINSSISEQLTVMVKMLLTVGMQQTFLDVSDIPEVLQKLVEMNKSGFVFRESFMMAMIWQAKAMALAQKAYMQSDALDDLQKWMYECCVLGDFLMELRREREALSIYQSLLSHLKSDKPDQEQLQYILLGKIGYAYANLQENESAYQSFSEAIRLAISIIKSDCDVAERASAFSDFQKLCKKLGDLYYEANQYSAALGLYQSYLDVQNMLVEKSEFDSGKQALADIYECIAETYHNSGQLESAKEYYLKCVPIRRSLYNEEPNQPHALDYAMCLRKLGALYIENRDTDSAMQYYQEALEINQHLSELSMSYQTSLNQIILYFKLGDLYFVLENLNKAESYYYKCLILSTDLVSRSGAVEAQEQLLDANIQLGQIAYSKEQSENALNYAHNAIKTGNDILKRRKTIETQMRIAIAYSLIGNIMLNQNKHREAAKSYRDSLNLFSDIAAETGSVEARRNAAIQIDNIGDLHRANGDYEAAEECYLEEQNILEMLAAESNSYEIQIALSSCYKNLGVLALAKKDYEKTDFYYQKALKICQHLAETAPHPEAKQALASRYHDCAILYRDNGQLRKSKNYFDKALSIRRELADTYHTVMYRHNLALTLLELAKLREQQHQFRDIRAYSTEALQICEKLAIDAPSFSTDDILADALEAVGSFYARYGSEPEFGVDDIDLYTRAIKLRVNIANTSQQVRDWDRLALLYYNSSLDIITPKWQKFYLYEALDTWQYLFERTQDPKYAERCEHTKKAISYYHLDDDNDS